MRFNYTHGKEAKYQVSIHRWNVSDFYYFSNYRDAKKCFNEWADGEEEGTSLSLWDMGKDVRKEYVRL